MWELNLFKRILPAFIVVIIGVVFYIATKYTVNDLFAYGYCATTMDASLNPTTWGLAYWIFGLMGIWVFFVFAIKAWTIVTGRTTLGGGDREEAPMRRRSKMSYGGETGEGPIVPFIRRKQ